MRGVNGQVRPKSVTNMGLMQAWAPPLLARRDFVVGLPGLERPSLDPVRMVDKQEAVSSLQLEAFVSTDDKSPAIGSDLPILDQRTYYKAASPGTIMANRSPCISQPQE
jgi:hypothetical protein